MSLIVWVPGALYQSYTGTRDLIGVMMDQDPFEIKSSTLGKKVIKRVWAEETWGKWWSWDPKETWALIIWIVYAIYLHGRKIIEWKGRKGAILSVVGFLIVIFTLFGVTYLMSGLHSYT